jgi:hypothetical protein
VEEDHLPPFMISSAVVVVICCSYMKFFFFPVCRGGEERGEYVVVCWVLKLGDIREY